MLNFMGRNTELPGENGRTLGVKIPNFRGRNTELIISLVQKHRTLYKV